MPLKTEIKRAVISAPPTGDVRDWGLLSNGSRGICLRRRSRTYYFGSITIPA
jgi:hypothetical protein